jgi:hypothetical protein
MTDIEAQVQEGTCDEALLFAVGSNATHGLRRTNADKRRAMTMLLIHPEYSEWSDRALARRACVGHDRHGNSGTMNTSNIGGRNRQRPQYTFQTAQVFDHVRQL